MSSDPNDFVLQAITVFGVAWGLAWLLGYVVMPYFLPSWGDFSFLYGHF